MIRRSASRGRDPSSHVVGILESSAYQSLEQRWLLRSDPALDELKYELVF